MQCPKVKKFEIAGLGLLRPNCFTFKVDVVVKYK